MAARRRALNATHDSFSAAGTTTPSATASNSSRGARHSSSSAHAAAAGTHVTGRSLIAVWRARLHNVLRQPVVMRVALFSVFATLAVAAVVPFHQFILPNLAVHKSAHAQAEIPGNSPLETCLDDEAQLIQIDELLVDPFPPVPGENVTISAKGTVKKDITDGAYVDVLVRYGFITLVNRRYDLCELLPEVDLECPVKAGFLSLSRSIELPDNVPPGEYSVEVKAFNVDDELLTCLTGVIEMDS